MTDITPPRASRFIPWLFVAGMAVVFAANGALIYFAAHSWEGLAVEHPYEDGIGYNRALAAAARQDRLGWAIEARLARRAGAPVIEVSATARDGRPLADLAVTAKLVRPVGLPETETVDLRPAADGEYVAAVATLAPGQWEAEITARRGGERMLVSRRVVLP